MESRSGRRSHSELPIRRCRQRSCCPCCETDGADRINGLPDSALLKVLVGVRCARTAALARRWRGLWRRLPELHLHGAGALAQVAHQELSVLDINVPKRLKFSAAGAASLLRAAPRCRAARFG